MTCAQPSSAHQWLGGHRCAVAMAFDLDGPTGSDMLSGCIWDRPQFFTQGAYGPWRGVDRILRVLDEFEIPATFFVPGWVVEIWPDLCQRILSDGHEIANHGYKHEKFWDLSDREQCAVIDHSQEVFQRYLGVSAKGFRTPSGDWTEETPGLLVKRGFVYSSSLRGDDSPFTIEGSGGLIEIPARSALDDYTATAYTVDSNWPSGGDRIASYPSTMKRWVREFEGYLQFGGVMSTIFHPKVSGSPGKVQILRGLLKRMRQEDDVWFATHLEIGRSWLAGKEETTC